MNLPSELFSLFIGIFCILGLATLIAQVMKSKQGRTPLIDNLIERINAWWAMVLLLGVTMSIGHSAIIVLFTLISFAALREFLTLTKKHKADHYALTISFFIVLPAQYLLVYFDWYGLYSIFIPVYVFLLLPIVSVVRGETEAFLIRISETQWALMICVFSASHVPALLMLDLYEDSSKNILLIAFLIVTVQISDVLQYVWGKLLGKRKIAPSLSPSKTWEGFLGGILSASLIGASLWWITPFSPIVAFFLSLMITLLGFFGGLVMSAIKRDRGIKDWGHIIAGHGGAIDRMDSIVFSAPIFFHIVRYFG